MKAPQIWIIAGPNGSGKTSLVAKYITRFKESIPFINPDEIAQTMNPDDLSSVAVKAGIEAIRRQEAYLKEKASFAIETTFSGKRAPRLLESAKEIGYKVNFIFICLENPKDSIVRVKNRFKAGGHDVPVKDVVRRYERSLKNMPSALQKSDRAFVLDNSGRRHRLKLVMEKGRMKSKSSTMPRWCQQHIPKWAFIKKLKRRGDL